MKFKINFETEFDAEDLDAAELMLLNYLREVINLDDLTAFGFKEVPDNG